MAGAQCRAAFEDSHRTANRLVSINPLGDNDSLARPMTQRIPSG